MSHPDTRAEPGASLEADGVLDGGGDMGAVMRSMDWSRTPLGPPGRWSQSLRTMVKILLANRFPLLLWWGPDQCQLYNDAYRPVLGSKHPRSMGQPARECWPEIWHIIGPLISTPYNGGPATWDDDLFLEPNRHGFVEETHFTIAYSPVPDESAPSGIGGVLATVHEITQQVIQERRVAALRDLGARSSEAKTAEEACEIAAEAFGRHAKDVPFALLYLLDEPQVTARLAGAAGIGMGEPASPLTVELTEGAGEEATWPFASVMRTEQPVVVEDLRKRFAAVPPGPWSDPPRRALVLPVPSNFQHRLAGLLVLGISARLELDNFYRSFCELATAQVATSVANARAHEAERRRAEELAELDRAKTAFFSNVSHEFRTPLTLLLGPLEDALASGDGALAPDRREQLEVAHRNALRLLRLVNTLLDFSRIEAGRAQASYERTDLPALTADLASSFRSAVERAGLRLAVDTPSLPEGAQVFVDREMWEKIVLNLVSNAFKHTFEGEIAVALRLATGGRAVELSVRDTGTGIPAEELPRLFERFHRVQGARARTHEGTGIGLALVQELVQLHGGAIAVASKEGEGTTFTVTIPVGTAHLPSGRVGAERSLASTATGAAAFVSEALRWLPDGADAELGASLELGVGLGVPSASSIGLEPGSSGWTGARVLVVDDNADMREYVSRLLGERYAVEAAPDGDAALATALERPPDLVLSDVMMPRRDGFGLLRALRDDPRTRDIPVILLSARAGEESKVEGLRADANDYLVKPFAARELLARVETHLELARARAAAAARERAARAEAESARQRLHELFMQAPAAICLLSGPDHVYALTNPRYLELIGRRDVLGKPVRDVFPELAGQGILDLLDQVYRTGQAFVGEELLIRLDRDRDGAPEDAYFNLVYAPLRGRDGESEGVFVHAYEVTDQVRARQEIEATVRARDEFLSIAAHELRTPMTGIKGTAELALRAHARGALTPERTEKALRAINLASDRLARLTDDLLDVSRIRGGQLALRPERTDLVALVRDVADRYGEWLEGDEGLKVELPGAPVVVEVDGGRLEQVLDNLLSNAVKYSPAGGPIEVGLETGADGVIVAIKDSGIGLPAGATERIFEPFGRAPNAAARNLPGMGLGLYISRRIAELHGGRLWAESAGEGRGTTMRMWLPMPGAASVAGRSR